MALNFNYNVLKYPIKSKEIHLKSIMDIKNNDIWNIKNLLVHILITRQKIVLVVNGFRYTLFSLSNQNIYRKCRDCLNFNSTRLHFILISRFIQVTFCIIRNNKLDGDHNSVDKTRES